MNDPTDSGLAQSMIEQRALAWDDPSVYELGLAAAGSPELIEQLIRRLLVSESALAA
jgi:hypothetical protein